MSARVRIVVVNHNRARLLDRCLKSLSASDRSAEQVEVVVVDNASTDESARLVRTEHPQVRWIQADRNLGFAGGNNLALSDLRGIDYVALLNNDAAAAPGWLTPLVQALAADPGLGAACPKVLFAEHFLEVELETATSVPGRGDYRRLGVRLSGASVNDRDCLRDVQFVRGWHGWENGSVPETSYQWSDAKAMFRLPSGPATSPARIRLASQEEQRVLIRSGDVERPYRVRRNPDWLDVELAGEPVDVINSAGGIAISGGYAGDRGFLEVDKGQYDSPAEVFAWSGCAVLLKKSYLEEVGFFDPRLFLYYEDFDLSWRGRAQGWRYVYVPDSVVRHVHAATSVEGSRLFQHYVERNRLLVHARNAPGSYAAYALLRYLGGTATHALRDIVSPLLHGHRPQPGRTLHRAATVSAFLWRVGPFLRDRRRLRACQQVSDEQLMEWVSPPGARG